MAAVELPCPFCGTDVVSGAAPVAGACPGCGAPFAGDGATVRDAVAAAAAAWGMDGVDVDEWTSRLFALEPDDPGADGAITSDRREGFYRWWVFRRP